MAAIYHSPRKKQKIYFGHPINTYNTKLEKQLLEKIREVFLGWDIENPNQKHHQEGYRRWKKTRGNGMGYFYQEVLPKCQAGVFLPFRDGKWGAGIYGEARHLSKQGNPIWQITAEGIISQSNPNKVEALSIKETVSRIRTPSGETIAY